MCVTVVGETNYIPSVYLGVRKCVNLKAMISLVVFETDVFISRCQHRLCLSRRVSTVKFPVLDEEILIKFGIQNLCSEFSGNS